jgi:DNA-binding NtrC family response regulator
MPRVFLSFFRSIEMSCIIISTDWRFKEKFKNRFSKSYLVEFSVASKFMQCIERGLFEKHDYILIDEKLGNTTQEALLGNLVKTHNAAKVFLFIDKGHKAPTFPSTDFPLQVLYKEKLDYPRFFDSLEPSPEVSKQNSVLNNQYFKDCLIGNSECMQEVREKLALYSTSSCSIHLTGETGTGKEIAANSIHHSIYPARKIVSINSSLLGSPIGESIFYGHSKGAYTDGRNEVAGLLEEANGSSLFLDEIENLPMVTQANMLRLLETGQYRRWGEPQLRYSSFKLITASNKNLQELIEKDRIRKDFFYRITDTTIRLPPLREHKEDIADLVSFYMQKNLPDKVIKQEDMILLGLYNWPGNVRQLFSLLKRCGVRSGKKQLLEMNSNDFE